MPMQKIRVCQFITELRPAGAERCVYELATRLPREQFEVEVLALRGGAYADQLSAAGIPVHVLDLRRRLDPKKFSQLVRILREGRFDILHTHLFHADLVGRPAARRAGVPHLVHSVHVAERRFRPWQFAWARWTRTWCDRIVCVSQGVRDFHARQAHLPLEDYTVIYNGVDVQRYARDPSQRNELRRRWGIAEGEVLCGFVGRLDEQKGIPELVDLMTRLSGSPGNTGPAIQFVLAGDGPMRGFLEEAVTRRGLARNVRVLGFTDDIPGVLWACDLFLQPSRWEGFCLAAAEAMAAGLPVVGTDVDGLNEVVADGQTGILCRVGDVAALTEAVRRLAQDPSVRERMGQLGRARVLEHFSVDRFVAGHQELYASMVATGPRE